VAIVSEWPQGEASLATGSTRCNDSGVVCADPLRYLLDAALEGDDVAVGRLVQCTQPAVWRLCTLLGSANDVEDLVQQTYLRALKSLPSFRREAPIEAWLLSIARRVCADDVRARTRQRRLVDRLSTGREQVVEPATGVDEMVQRLPAPQREAFVLTQVLGLSYEEAAVVADCPIGTIRSRVARARAELVRSLRQADAR
jgi:RNA polymerase sigma-70 factor (ECF subfamily)